MKIKYGNKEISFVHHINPKLKHAYVTVDSFDGVVLKSPPMEENQAKALVRKKAAWIMQKSQLTAQEPTGDIVTGSRIPYLGKKYYTEIIGEAPPQKTADALVVFNYSRFKIFLDPACNHPQQAIAAALDNFYRQKAIDKITPRFHYWRNVTGLEPSALKFRKMDKRWGSCTASNAIIINIYAVKLPLSSLDYILVHELCHLKHKYHTREFWREVESYKSSNVLTQSLRPSGSTSLVPI